jgi:hypothetical protein
MRPTVKQQAPFAISYHPALARERRIAALATHMPFTFRVSKGREAPKIFSAQGGQRKLLKRVETDKENQAFSLGILCVGLADLAAFG